MCAIQRSEPWCEVFIKQKCQWRLAQSLRLDDLPSTTLKWKLPRNGIAQNPYMTRSMQQPNPTPAAPYNEQRPNNVLYTSLLRIVTIRPKGIHAAKAVNLTQALSPPRTNASFALKLCCLVSLLGDLPNSSYGKNDYCW
jgi:hypothetical protein